MRLQTPENANYAAIVVKLTAITPLEGSDNIVGTPIFGFQAIVGKSSQVGDIGIVFPAETQLNDEFCRENNLYRHRNLNKDESAKGYIEDNRRVKAMKFRGHRSDCLFMPLSSLTFTGVKVDELKIGDTFDELLGHKICEKYQVKRRSRGNTNQAKAVRFTRVDAKFLPEHLDTDNFFRNVAQIPAGSQVVVTQKVHGSSLRAGHTIVTRKLGMIEGLLKRFGVRIEATEYDYVFGSRKVIKDVHNPDGGFYSSDIWTEAGKRLEGVLPQNIIYGELVGWTPDGGDIQKNYHYGQPTGTNELYVYRVAVITAQGRLVDLSWDQVKTFCTELGIKHVAELWRGKIEDFDVQQFLDKRFFDSGYTQALPLDDDKALVDEGVCVRVDGLTPYILKAKSPVFLGYESKMLDEEAVDLESEESQTGPEEANV